MSTLVGLLANRQGGPSVPIGGGDDPPPPGSAVDPRPIVDDPILMSMRPDGQRVALLRVGPAREYSTIEAALARGSEIQTAARLANNGSLTRDMRVDIVIDPGEYSPAARYVSLSHHVGLYAADGGHGTVLIHGGLEMSGGWNHVEGIHWLPPDSTSKYPHHHAAIGVSVFARSIYTALARGAGGGLTPIGMDGNSGGETYWYDCDLAPAGQYTNTHGHAGNIDPLVTAWIRCRFPSGGLQYANGVPDDDPDHPGNSDTLWAVDCEAGWIGVEGKGALYYGDRNTLTGGTPPGVAYRQTPTEVRSDWPVPIGGLSTAWRARLGLPPA